MSGRSQLWSYARRDRSLLGGLVIVGVALVLAVIGPLVAPYDPRTATGDVYLPPSWSHPFGTDSVGMDVFSRSIAAFQIDVFMAVAAVSVSCVIGTFLGAIAGFSFSSRAGRSVGWVLLRLTDMVQSFPVFIMAFALVGTFGPSVFNVVLAIAFVSIPAFLRLARGSVMTVETEAYVDAAKVTGLSERKILMRHVIPNSLDPVIANASIAIGVSILMTTGLSFLGAGVRPPTPEWGLIIADGSSGLVTGAWWVSILPGILLATTVAGFALVGDGVRRFLSPAERQAFLSLRSGDGR